jgi:predicted esterase
VNWRLPVCVHPGELFRVVLFAFLSLLLASRPAISAETGKDEMMPTAALSALPLGQPATEAYPAGLTWLEGSGPRKPALYVPPGLRREAAVPLVVLLHGAGGGASDILPLMQAEAERRKFLLLAPQSQGPTWDVIVRDFGPDVTALDHSLRQVFKAFRVDPERIAVAGFSDGASYALTIGLANGELFKHVLAFSPGFIAPTPQAGAPRVFVSHGDADSVLPIDRCSRRIVPRLEQAGYAVDYREFRGGHVVPAEMVTTALDRFLAGLAPNTP